ncbi:unnamed protein product [Brugia pahangi]|uniref:Uncharacterized protein n=1 Tax=Brugia pahangi TaxID=6280 RepID=A0A0N4T2S1_BRUPA|nr:unnamed protein product [Brugia pahangi]
MRVLPALQTQESMGAFGHTRCASIKGDLHYESHSFHRQLAFRYAIFRILLKNVSDVIDNYKFDESKTPHVKYLDYMSPICDPESHDFISQQFSSTSAEKAASTIIDDEMS